MVTLFRVVFDLFHNKALVQFFGNRLYMEKHYLNRPISTTVMEERIHSPPKRVVRLPMKTLLLFGVAHIWLLNLLVD